MKNQKPKKVTNKKVAKKVVTKKPSKTVSKTTNKKLKKNNSFETKMKMVSNHLVKHGSITSWEAINKFRATRLSAIIFILKERGWLFRTVLELHKKSRFARYHLLNAKNNGIDISLFPKAS